MFVSLIALLFKEGCREAAGGLFKTSTPTPVVLRVAAPKMENPRGTLQAVPGARLARE